MLQAVKLVRTALDDFYGTLSDEQKAQKFEAIGPQRTSSRRANREVCFSQEAGIDEFSTAAQLGAINRSDGNNKPSSEMWWLGLPPRLADWEFSNGTMTRVPWQSVPLTATRRKIKRPTDGFESVRRTDAGFSGRFGVNGG